MTNKSRLLTVLLLVVSSSPAHAKEELVTLNTREAVEQKFLLIETPNAVASLILFAGGKGTLKLSAGASGVTIRWGKNNFLVRSREVFARHGFNVAVVDAPSDHQARRGMLDGFRTFAEHVIDIDAVIADLRERANVPVWLIGTSRGTESAAHIAIHSKQGPHGLVLTSSMSEPNNKGTAVTEMELSRITLPTLIVAHKHDGCWVTPPEGAEEISKGLSKSVNTEVAYFAGGREEVNNPCQARSHHGFLGIEDRVIKRIAEFIKSN